MLVGRAKSLPANEPSCMDYAPASYRRELIRSTLETPDWQRRFHAGRQSTPQRPWHRNWSCERDKAPPHSGQTQFAMADLRLSFDGCGLSILKKGLSTNIPIPPCSLHSLGRACTSRMHALCHLLHVPAIP